MEREFLPPRILRAKLSLERERAGDDAHRAHTWVDFCCRLASSVWAQAPSKFGTMSCLIKWEGLEFFQLRTSSLAPTTVDLASSNQGPDTTTSSGSYHTGYRLQWTAMVNQWLLPSHGGNLVQLSMFNTHPPQHTSRFYFQWTKWQGTPTHFWSLLNGGFGERGEKCLCRAFQRSRHLVVEIHYQHTPPPPRVSST